MEELIRKIRSYEARVREAFFEIARDPYTALMDCSFIRKAIGEDDSLSKMTKARINKQIRDTEDQADFDWIRNGYC